LLAFTLVAPMLWAAPAAAAPTVAILDLENNTGDPAFNGAGPGVAGLLISRFQQTSAVDVVERIALEAVLTEHKLSRSALADPATAAQTGRLVGARYVVTGQLFTVQLPTLSVSLRVVDTQSGEVVASRDVVGKVGNDGEAFFTLVDQLADEILAALDVHLSDDELQAMSKAELRELAAVLRYGDRLMAGPSNHPMALFRDTSADYSRDAYTVRQWKVYDIDRRVVEMPTFARRIGDTEMNAEFSRRLDAVHKRHRRNNRVALASFVGGLATVIVAGTRQDDTSWGTPVLIGASVLTFSAPFQALGNQIGVMMRVDALSAPGAFYTPEEADRWIAGYNSELK